VRRSALYAILGLLLPLPCPGADADDPPFEWRDGDRVVLIGDALIEREQEYGHLETLLTLHQPGKSITFRNLGWSGDTVHGVARAGFDKPEEGFRRLREHVLALKPTVLIVGYGMTDSFDGEAGLTRFRDGLVRLLDAVAPTGARPILLSPIAHEDRGRPLPDPAPHNGSLRLYRDAIRDVARQRGARFLDLFEATSGGGESTDDGIHLVDRGYRSLAVRIDGALRNSRRCTHDLDATPVAELRRAIVEKNRLYFYRWRPQNETYLFGFRKHEQGNNAREIPLFDPLVDAKEAEIARRKEAVAHACESGREESK
jgi:lysophospholipase L1-like esterase